MKVVMMMMEFFLILIQVLYNCWNSGCRGQLPTESINQSSNSFTLRIIYSTIISLISVGLFTDFVDVEGHLGFGGSAPNRER
jgi:hypothetical protein